MKNTFKPALFVLLMCGVFGADEVKAVSVMEGDSVTLNPDLTQIQGFLEIEWHFKDQLIAYTDGSKPTYPEDERFRDRLKLDHKTGSLTITNMKTKHSGLYNLQIELNSGLLPVNFTVTVYDSPSVIDAVKGEMKIESVKEGDPVTLQTDVTQLSRDELIVWRFGEEGKLIAKADIEAKSSPLYDTEESFRGRLELDQTGSLIITNTRTTDSGLYKVKISRKNQTVYKRFTVTVSGAVAGIVVLLCVAAAAAAGVIYYRHKISELQKQTLTVKEGDPVTLKPNKEIKKDDKIEWQFGDKSSRLA
ncbi:uncharacterized protein LOC131530794 isoform X2 [Onychostoma macrolepis]|uniref:uncharacterized protein LOC131530794 isoform X2 n=1 Tax=Onychostoma macrolepis TaxID=369639 RepID=UPI00272A2A03|nr:uncharacterized protein LOC131530794 isoform X2 [Onychostoma macrolepis]